MKLNINFAKPVLKDDGTPDYAPAILKVVTHHHEEWDEPVFDPDTGEPTGETRHRTRDWDTSETKMWPTAEDYHKMNYLDVVDQAPTLPPPEGYHYDATGWEVVTDTASEESVESVHEGGVVRRVYELLENPKPTLSDYDAAMEAHLTAERCARGYTTREPDMYINSEVPRWASDAKDWVAHRDAVMLYALEIMNAVESGEREPPTMDEFVSGLPDITWSFESDGDGDK